MFHCRFVINKVLPICFGTALCLYGSGAVLWTICFYCFTLLLLYASMPLQFWYRTVNYMLVLFYATPSLRLYDSGIIVLWSICLYYFTLLLLYASTPVRRYASTPLHLYTSRPLQELKVQTFLSEHRTTCPAVGSYAYLVFMLIVKCKWKELILVCT